MKTRLREESRRKTRADSAKNNRSRSDTGRVAGRSGSRIQSRYDEEARFDDRDVGAFVRQLEDLETDVDRAYAFDEQPFAAGKIVPLEIKNKPSKKYTTYRQITHLGQFKLMRNYSTDLPTVEVLFEEFRREIFKWGSSYYWSDDDIAAFVETGESLDTEKIYAVNEASSQTLNKLIAYGDRDLGMPGFLNHPDALRSIAPYPLNSSATAQQKLSVLNDCANASPKLTKQVEKPDTLLMDIESYQSLSSEIIQIGSTALNKTVLAHFVETNPYIKEVGVVNELLPDAFADEGLPRKRQIMAFNRNINKVKAQIYQPLTFKEARRMGVDSWTRAAVFKYAGIALKRPYSMHIVELPE